MTNAGAVHSHQRTAHTQSWGKSTYLGYSDFLERGQWKWCFFKMQP